MKGPNPWMLLNCAICMPIPSPHVTTPGSDVVARGSRMIILDSLETLPPHSSTYSYSTITSSTPSSSPSTSMSNGTTTSTSPGESTTVWTAVEKSNPNVASPPHCRVTTSVPPASAGSRITRTKPSEHPSKATASTGPPSQENNPVP